MASCLYEMGVMNLNYAQRMKTDNIYFPGRGKIMSRKLTTTLTFEENVAYKHRCTDKELRQRLDWMIEIAMRHLNPMLQASGLQVNWTLATTEGLVGVDHVPDLFLGDGANYFRKMTPIQRAFHEDTAKYRYIKGDVGTGKSTAALAEGVLHSINHEDNLGVVITDAPTTFLESIQKMLPDGAVLNYSVMDGWIDIRCAHDKDARSRIYFKTHSKAGDGKPLYSYSLGWFYVDDTEKMNVMLCKTLQERLRGTRGIGRGWFVGREDFDMLTPHEQTSQFIFTTEETA